MTLDFEYLIGASSKGFLFLLECICIATPNSSAAYLSMHEELILILGNKVLSLINSRFCDNNFFQWDE